MLDGNKKSKGVLLLERTMNLLLLFILLKGINAVCHEHSGTTYDCSSSDLLRVPDNIPHNTTILDLTFNNISTLYANDFLSLADLITLDLSFNPISRLHVLAFSGLSSLMNLRLFGHYMDYKDTSLPIDTFKTLHNLHTLGLRRYLPLSNDHQELRLPDKAIGSIPTLRELNIDTAPKTVFGIGFSNLTSLKSLVIGVTNQFPCGISQLTANTFFSFCDIEIISLDLNGCHLQHIDSKTLVPLTFLQYFLFDKGRYTSGNLSGVINALAVYRHKNMSRISITYMYSNNRFVGTGYALSLETLSDICVTDLDLSGNNIVAVNYDKLFTPYFPLLTKCIKRLCLKENSISGTARKAMFGLLYVLSNLEYIDLSMQRIFQYNHFEGQKQPTIQRYPLGLPFFIPPKLKHLNIAGAFYMMGELVDIYILNGDNVLYLNMSHCGMTDFYHKIRGLQNLQCLDLSGNDLSILSKDFFNVFPNLTTLRISNSRLDTNFFIEYGKRVFEQIHQLEYLDMSDNNIGFLQVNIFDPLTSIRVINLVNNNLVVIPDVSLLWYLEQFHMSYNSLSSIDKRARNMLDKLVKINHKFHISVYGNPFSCMCQSFEFLVWLQETTVNFDGGNYTCMDVDGQMTTTLSIYNKLPYFHRQCTSQFWLNLGMGGLSMMLVFIGGAFVIIKNKMKMKLILLRMIGQNIYPQQRSEFPFDLFIVYTNITYRFVCNYLRIELEVKRRIKLNIYDRDQNPYGFHLKEICQAINESWKIVLILTDEFLTSDTALFIMCNCLSAIRLSTPMRLILLVQDGTRIPTDIGFLLDAVPERNILYVDLNGEFTDIFWERFSNVVLQLREDEQ